MEPISESHKRGSRQACEACRRKKTKCPAERPICSFCQRLDIDCVYLPRENARSPGSVKKSTKSNTKDRVRVLEAQVNDLYQVLDSFANFTGGVTPDTLNSHDEIVAGSSSIVSASSHTLIDSKFSITQPRPSPQAFNHMLETYKQSIHLQPLPLFSFADIEEYLKNAPGFLLWSFLALTLTFSSHEFYHGLEEEAIQFYADDAEEKVMKLAFEGTVEATVVQSLCLLAMRYIKESKMAKAWMIIGTASRLETLRSSRQDFGEGLNSDVNSHCYWSVFISERAFFPQQTGLLSMGNLPDYPKSAPLPPSVDLAGDINYHPDLTSSNEQIKNLGINSYYIQMVSFWGEITSYLNDVRHGKAEVPWLPDSTHIKLNMKLHEFEAQLPEQHLVRGVFRSRRSSIEVHEQKEYWLPWFTMQVISHSSAAIVNHPFIHLAAVKERQGISQSRLFLQQTVDQALYHSGWVFRLLGICEDLELQIVNPLIGQLVAANATIQWIFQYAHDEKVSKSASEHLAVCARLLERIANVWPSIAEKVEALRDLQSIAESELPNLSGKTTTISFRPSVLWKLLDPKLVSATEPRSTNQGQSRSRHDISKDTRLRVVTHFVHPLENDQPEQPFLPGCNMVPSFPAVEEVEQLHMGDLFAQCAGHDIDWLQ